MCCALHAQTLLLKLFRCAIVCYVEHTFLCPYKLCNVCLFRCVSLIEFCFEEYCSFLWTSAALSWLFLQDILKAFLKFLHQLYIIKIIILEVLQFLGGENRTSISDTLQYPFFCLVTQHHYHFDTISIKLVISLHWCSRQKDVWIFRSAHLLAFWKNQKTYFTF